MPDNAIPTFASELDSEFIFPGFCLEIQNQKDHALILIALLDAGYKWSGDYINSELARPSGVLIDAVITQAPFETAPS